MQECDAVKVIDWNEFHGVRDAVMALIAAPAAATPGAPEADALASYVAIIDGYPNFSIVSLLRAHIRLARAYGRRNRAKQRLERTRERLKEAQMVYDHATAKYEQLRAT